MSASPYDDALKVDKHREDAFTRGYTMAADEATARVTPLLDAVHEALAYVDRGPETDYVIDQLKDALDRFEGVTQT